MTGRAFVKLKFAWLDQVLADQTLPPMAFLVAYLLASRFLNRKTGTAWPTQQTIARLLHASERQVRRSIEVLAVTGT